MAGWLPRRLFWDGFRRPRKPDVDILKKVLAFVTDNNIIIHGAGFFMLALAVLWVTKLKFGDIAGFGAIAGVGTFCLGIGQWTSK